MRSRRASWSLRTIPCGWCGKRVRESESGRERRWCSDACRMKSYRAQAAQCSIGGMTSCIAGSADAAIKAVERGLIEDIDDQQG